MKNKAYNLILFSILAFNCYSQKQSDIKWEYPKITPVYTSKEYFGTKVIDEFKMLENLDNDLVKSWYKQEQEFYSKSINSIRNKDSVVQQIKSLRSTSKFGLPSIPRVTRNAIFYKRRSNVDNSIQLIKRDLSTNEEILLFSTLSWNGSNKGKFRLDYFEPSFDGKFIAFGVSVNGDEMSTLYVLDVNKKTILADSIKRCMYGNPNWLSDGSGFFYNQLKDAEKSGESVGIYENSKAKLHRLGQNPNDDLEIFSKRLHANLRLENIDFPYILTFPNSSKVLAVVYRGSDIYCLTYCANLVDVLKSPANAIWQNISNVEDKVTAHALFANDLFLVSYKENPLGQIRRIDVNKPSTSKVVFQSVNSVLQEIIQTTEFLYVKSLKDGINWLTKINPIDLSQSEIGLPLKGSVSLSSDGKPFVNGDLYIGLDSWTHEYGIYVLSKEGVQTTNIAPKSNKLKGLDLVSKELLVKSHDGTLVPLSIIHTRGVKLDGRNPTILDAYGAYGTSITPFFSTTKLAWFRNGGIYAVAHVRGGGENGDKWYRGGYKATKENSWKDYISCAEYLISNKYTSQEKLGALAASAGAITIGRAITERPELFKAAVIKVGDLNILRSENSKNTMGISEFGTNKDSVEFNYLYHMDVYHHIRNDIQYPSILFTSALNDARVDFWQAAKAVAKLQAGNSKKSVFLLRLSDEGHSGASDSAVESGEIYSFLLWQLGHPEFVFQNKN